MLFIFIVLILIPLIWIIVYPLVVCYLYKFKYGNKVYVLYFPLLGQFKYRIDGVRFHKDVIYHKRKIAYEHPNVELIVTHIFSRPYLIFISPEKAKLMLYNYHEYKKRSDEIFRDIIACQGLVYAEGQTWKNQRKELADFFTFEQLSSRIPVIKQLIKEVLQFENDTRVHIIQKCAIIASRTMQICFFNQTQDAQFNGRNLSEEFQELSKMFILITYGSIIHQARSFFGIKSNSTMKRWLMTNEEKHFLERVLKVRAYINRLIDNHKPGQNKDVFTLLLKDLTVEMREQIIHQYITFVFAGTDTTSHVAGMAIYMLGVHKEIQEQLRVELQNVPFDDVDQGTLTKLPLLNSFINECLRLQTPSDGLIPRLAIRNHYVGEYYIRKDWYVDVGLQPMMTHPNYFKNNLTFDLNRWKNQSEPEAFIPFSVGPRNCLGQHLAKMEAKLILIYILKMYRVIVDEETDLVMEQAFLYSPQDDRLVKFIKL